MSKKAVSCGEPDVASLSVPRIEQFSRITGGLSGWVDESSTLEQTRPTFISPARSARGVRQSALSRAATREAVRSAGTKNHANFPSTTKRFFSADAYSQRIFPGRRK